MKIKINLTRRLKPKLLVWALFFSFTFGYAQTSEIKGTVIAEGFPIGGVNVIIKGTINGTYTDFDGNYTIKAEKGSTLLYSYVGYKTKEILITDQKNINVTLEPDAAALQEVIVIGYGTQKKKEVTGAIVSVSNDVIEKTATSDLGTALQGQVAGVNIQASSGRPGEAANVQIRGLGSVSPNALVHYTL